MSEVWSLESLKGRIASFYNEKQAAEKVAQGNMPSEKDPQEKGAPSAEKHDGDSAEKTVLPSAGLSVTNRDGDADDGIPAKGEASGKDPNGAGEGGHSAPGGDAADDAVSSPTDPSVTKTATQAKALAEAIRAKLLKPASNKAETEATTQEEKEAHTEAHTEATEEQLAANFNEDANAYQKIASLVMGYEEGRQLVTDLADRELGKQAAESLIKEAAELEQLEVAYQQSILQGEADVDAMLKNASQEDIQDIEKLIVAHSGAKEGLEYDFEKEAYDLGVKQAAAAMDETGGEMPLEGEDVSLDEVAAIVMQMVESGELEPQLAEAILGELAGADAGGGDPAMGGSPEEMAMAEAAMGGGGDPAAMGGSPEEMAMAEEAAKMASQVFGAATVSELQKVAAAADALEG
jgi:hypothetical protein